MKNRNSKIAVAAFLAAAFLGAPLHAAVLSGVQVHFISGPVSLSAGQSATACATNPDDSPISILIGLLQADSSSLLASRQITLQPGMGVCLGYARPTGQQQQELSPNVYAVVIPNGRVDSLGRIVQVSPGGGGCIVASLQIQTLPINNFPGQTIVYAQMIQHHHARE